MVYAPVPQPGPKKDAQGSEVHQDKHEPKLGDSETVAKWRQHMVSDEAKDTGRQRAATAECVNAQPSNRATEACCKCRCEAWPRSASSWACSC